MASPRTINYTINIGIPDERIEAIMASLDALTTSVNNLNTSLTDMKARVAADVQALKDLIEGLELEQAQIDELTSQVDAIKANVDSVDPIPPEQVPPTEGGETPPPTEPTEG